MKLPLLFQRAGLLAVLVGGSLWLGHYEHGRHSLWKKLKNPETVRQLQWFVAQTEAHANTSAQGVPPEFQRMFKNAESGDWLTLSNSYQELNEQITYWASLGYGVRRSNDYRGRFEDLISDATAKIGRRWEPRAPPRLDGISGEAVMEVHGALEDFAIGNEEYSTQFGREIIDSIPAGSIYFGGSAAGRFIVTAMSNSQTASNSFFILPQNALMDQSYLNGLRNRYGTRIYIPNGNDIEKCRQDFIADTNLWTNASGQIGGLLAKIVFQKNPGREFFIDNGCSVSWMFPYLEPHGLIFKLNRQPTTALSDEIVARDHEYWTQHLKSMIGDWLTEATAIADVAAFVEKTYGRQDLGGFKGDLRFIQNEYSRRMFSGPRSAIATFYQWRADQATGPADKKRMLQEADFAFRQAWALGPDSSEAVYRYVDFLLDQNRFESALLIANTATALPQNQDNDSMTKLPAQLKQWRQEHPSVTSK